VKPVTNEPGSSPAFVRAKRFCLKVLEQLDRFIEGLGISGVAEEWHVRATPPLARRNLRSI